MKIQEICLDVSIKYIVDLSIWIIIELIIFIILIIGF